MGMTHQPAHIYSQTGFRGRNDDGSEITATWISPINQIWVQVVDEAFRIRFLVQKDLTGGPETVGFQLNFSINDGTFINVGIEGSGTAVEMRATVQPAGYDDGDNCTQQLGASAQFIGTNLGVSEGDDSVSNDMTWPQDSFNTSEAEFEYTILFNSNVVAINDRIELKLFDTVSGATNEFEGGYPEVPIFTVSVGSILRLKGGTARIKGGTIQLR